MCSIEKGEEIKDASEWAQMLFGFCWKLLTFGMTVEFDHYMASACLNLAMV
jgi:hypothetical protein